MADPGDGLVLANCSLLKRMGASPGISGLLLPLIAVKLPNLIHHFG